MTTLKTAVSQTIFTFIGIYLLPFPQKAFNHFLQNFKNFNRESCRTDIAQQNWTCNGSDDPNVLRADWKTKFLDVVYFHAPLRTSRARMKKAPWINSEY